MSDIRGRNGHKIAIVLGIALVFAIGFLFLGMFVDIQIILKQNYTPISFTLLLPFVGALIGFFLGLRTMSHMNSESGPSN